jgi:hypothetical protein
MEASIVYYHTLEGVITALVVPTSRKLHAVFFHAKRGLVHKAVALEEEQFMRQAMELKKGLPKFGGIARRKGSTKAARTWLAKARECIS